MLLYLVLQDVNYCIRLGFACSTRPHNNRTMLYDFRFVLMLVCFSAQIFCRRLARSTHKLDFPFSNFGFLVLHSHKRYVMFKCIAVLADQDRARDPISVAYFNQVALFSDFNDLFELLGPGFAPFRSSAFYILELSAKNILKTLAANSMNNFHVVLTHVAHTKPLSRMQSLSVSRGRSKVTKWAPGQNLFLVIVQCAISKECARGGRWEEGKSESLSPFHHPPRALISPLLGP